jgi:hypothetical protein
MSDIKVCLPFDACSLWIEEPILCEVGPDPYLANDREYKLKPIKVFSFGSDT